MGLLKMGLSRTPEQIAERERATCTLETVAVAYEDDVPRMLAISEVLGDTLAPERRNIVMCPACECEQMLVVMCESQIGHNARDELRWGARCLNGCTTDALRAAIVTRGEQLAAENAAAIEAKRVEQAKRERAAMLDATLADLLPKTSAATESPPLIDRVLARGIKQLVVARSYGGKSLYAFSQAIAVATGTPWNGHPTTRARVMLILLDGQRGDDHLRRLRGLAAGAGADFDQLVSERWIMFYDPRDEDGEPEPLHLDDPDRVARLMSVIDVLDEADMAPGLIVADNWTRLRGNRTLGAGNDPGVTDELWQPIEALAARCITTTVIHHANKKGGTMGSELNDGAADLSVFLDRDSKKHDAWIAVTGESRSPCITEMVVRFVGGVGADGAVDGSPIRIESRAAKAKDAEPVEPSQNEDEQRRAWLLAALPAKAEALYEAMLARGVRRNDTLALRKKMDEHEIECVDGVWRRKAQLDGNKTP